MNRFFRWLGTPIRATRALFPFTHEGRQTLIYLVFAGSGPALTALVLWIMREALARRLFGVFGNMAWLVGWSLFVIVCGLGMFVSIRAIKLGKDGFSAEGGTPDDAGGGET